MKNIFEIDIINFCWALREAFLVDLRGRGVSQHPWFKGVLQPEARLAIGSVRDFDLLLFEVGLSNDTFHTHYVFFKINLFLSRSNYRLSLALELHNRFLFAAKSIRRSITITYQLAAVISANIVKFCSQYHLLFTAWQQLQQQL